MEAIQREMSVECGVPQGSCRGPLMCYIFTNNLPLVLKSTKLRMYADYITVYASAPTSAELTAILKEEFDTIGKWILENKLIINTFKTKSIVFGSNHSLRFEPELRLYINKTLIQQVKETWVSPLTINGLGHIDNTVNKMG